MRPTRRGWAVVALIAACVYMALSYGPRSLNAVAAPSLVALAAAAIQLRRQDAPAVERHVADAGIVGDELAVELRIETPTPVGARLHDAVGEWLPASGNPTTTTVGNRSVRYDVRLDRRGVHEIGPLEITITDVLGLLSRTFRYDATDRVLAYPTAYRLDPPADGPAVLPSQSRQVPGRDEFDGLREYERGDSLRDVHWKSTARRSDDEMLVQQYVANRRNEVVTVAVDPGERPDPVAEAAASVALHLLDRQFSVGLVTPDGRIAAETGTSHQRAVLEALGRLEAGQLADDTDDADLLVSAAGGGAVVAADEESVPFGHLVAMRNGERVHYRRVQESGGTDGPVAATSRGEVAP
jgi:uncharacterized protein (DUF58 family)